MRKALVGLSCLTLPLLATTCGRASEPAHATDAGPGRAMSTGGSAGAIGGDRAQDASFANGGRAARTSTAPDGEADAGALDVRRCRRTDPARPDDCDGVCTSVETDPGNCGGCGAACSGGAVCLRGRCSPTCATDAGAPLTNCDGACVSLASNADHCGTCRNPCTGGQICVEGQCACPTASLPSVPETLCNGVCIDTLANASHCGGLGGIGGPGAPSVPSYCNSVCPPDDGGPPLCVLGACAKGVSCALRGESVCNGGCVDFSVNNANCGGCNNVCAGGSTCELGRCTCPGGDAYCHGMCLPVSDDAQNCGACDARCGAGTACVGGKCR